MNQRIKNCILGSWTLGLIIYGSTSHSVAQNTTNPIVIAKGQTQVLAVPPGARIRIGNGRILKVKDQGTSLLLIGKSNGTTELYLGSRTRVVHVVGVDQREIFVRLLDWLKGREGLGLQVGNDRVTVTGDLLRLSDWVALGAALENDPGRFEFSAKLHTDLQIQARDYFESLLAEAHLPAAALSFQPRATVGLPPQDKDEASAFEAVLRKYGFQVQIHSRAISIEPQVEIQVRVAEIKKNFLQKYGVRWPSAYEAKLLPPGGAAGEPTASLQALEQNGGGKILASPTLLCRSGKEAQFLAGGEIPIKIMNFKVNDVVWKKYGVMLKFRPRADYGGRMSIELETEVSSLDKASAVDGIPGLFTNRVSSHFDLEGTRTIALSGLIKRDQGDSSEGLPLLTRLPILGPLFSSRDFSESRSELVIFVTPQVLRGSQTSQTERGWHERELGD